MGTPKEVVADGRLYSVVDDLAIEHRLVARGQLTDAVTALAPLVPVRVRPLYPRAFAVVQPGAEYLVAVGADPPPTIEIEFTAVGYEMQTITLTVPAPGTVAKVDVSLVPV